MFVIVPNKSGRISSLGKRFLMMMMILSMHGLAAQSSKEKIYAVFLLNFGRFIEWPAEANSSEFVIGVLDNSPLASELKNVAKVRSVQNRKIKVNEYTNVNEIGFCHILFIPEHKSSFVTSVIGKFPYTPTLLVTEKEGLAKKGSNINFLLVEGRVVFEINERAIKGRGLKIPLDLQSLGVTVE